MRYLLNSAVITGPGLYSYRLVSRDEAAEWLKEGSWVSRIGYGETAAHIQAISGVKPDICRDATPLRAGDEALVVRLKYRLQDPAQKATWVPGPDDWEYGLLKVLDFSIISERS